MITIRATYGVLRISEPQPASRQEYCKYTDPKWLKFTKAHNLNFSRDSFYKWYNMYLELCANGLL